MSAPDRKQFDTLLTSICKNLDRAVALAWTKRGVSPFLARAVKEAGSVGELPATWQPELPQGRKPLTEAEKLAKKYGKLSDAEKAEVRGLIGG